jgi:hypothetical protein
MKLDEPGYEKARRLHVETSRVRRETARRQKVYDRDQDDDTDQTGHRQPELTAAALAHCYLRTHPT